MNKFIIISFVLLAINIFYSCGSPPPAPQNVDELKKSINDFIINKNLNRIEKFLANNNERKEIYSINSELQLKTIRLNKNDWLKSYSDEELNEFNNFLQKTNLGIITNEEIYDSVFVKNKYAEIFVWGSQPKDTSQLPLAVVGAFKSNRGWVLINLPDKRIAQIVLHMVIKNPYLENILIGRPEARNSYAIRDSTLIYIDPIYAYKGMDKKPPIRIKAYESSYGSFSFNFVDILNEKNQPEWFAMVPVYQSQNELYPLMYTQS